MNSRLGTTLVLAQIVSAAAMTAIIWFVQLITYPQFLEVEAASFTAFHERYTTALTPLVAPLMIAELALSILSVRIFWRTPLRAHIVAASALTVLLWLITFLIQVPLHDQLSRGWSEPEIRNLLGSNWIRTVLWTARLALLFFIGMTMTAGRNPKPN